MFRKLIILILIVTIFGVDISYSQAKIDFVETTFDFGQIEEGTIAVHQFTFFNNGDQPLIISSVKASCGCTTPDWSKEPILPGNQGYVKASYSSRNRPGGFHKSITITSNAATSVIYIMGNAVKSHQLTPLFTVEELNNSARAEITQQHRQIGKVPIGSSIQVNITIKNLGNSSLEIKGIYSSCRCISLMPSKNLMVEPNTQGTLELIFTPMNLGEYTNEIQILSNDLIQPKYLIYLTSTVVPQQSKTSLVKESPPKITF